MSFIPRALIMAVGCLPYLTLANQISASGHERPLQASAGVWSTFSPAGAPFSVMLRGMPTERTKDLASSIIVRTYPLRTLSGEYLVVWATGLLGGSSKDDLLDSLFPLALKRMLKLAGAGGGRFHGQFEKELVLNGNRGRESVMETWSPNAHEIRCRGYTVGSDFVALVALHAKEEDASPETLRFFDSLMLFRTGTANRAADDAEPSTETGSYRDSDHAEGADTDPVPLSSPQPNYTESAKANRVQGPVKLRVLVNKEGDVIEISLRSHLPDGLDQEAVRSVRVVKFMPATKDGQASRLHGGWIRKWIFG